MEIKWGLTEISKLKLTVFSTKMLNSLNKVVMKLRRPPKSRKVWFSVFPYPISVWTFHSHFINNISDKNNDVPLPYKYNNAGYKKSMKVGLLLLACGLLNYLLWMVSKFFNSKHKRQVWGLIIKGLNKINK